MAAVTVSIPPVTQKVDETSRPAHHDVQSKSFINPWPSFRLVLVVDRVQYLPNCESSGFVQATDTRLE
jgi:hypothetical protein